ncbi:PepSY domain-containing protein [Acinetobacter qingfengensis]|uniref:Histidine kinase n=1 Tax=Acinetobacter qingfengensis TaxID=1262585 RepID=A0A1E7RF58_9GAMM|nr:PepSY domain-containing protein [Acinetobacter qingfengensis]KAA8735616.1 PepSY domain-containing protein [Acinetobacter qingfengensis]OEY97933.1 histidine kinase [Acinetobacter qingfengensis]
MKVRADIIKVAKNLHTWVGITAGIFLFICFFAGGLTMFQHDLSRWAAPTQQQLPKIELNQYNHLIEEVQKRYPETHQSFLINFSAKEGFNAPMQWEPAHSSDHDDHGFNAAQGTMLASLDQQGNLIVQQQNVSKIGWLIEQLHETAGIPGTLGHHTIGVYVMGIVAVLYFLAIMSGLIVLLPTLVKDFFAIRPGKNKKRFWLDTHNVIGITSLPFHIIIAISVIVFAFHDLFYVALGKLAFKDQPLFERPAPMVIEQKQPKLDIEKIYHRIHQQTPNYQILGLSLRGLDKPAQANTFAAVYNPDQMLRGDNFDYLSFNPYQTSAYNLSTLDTHASNADRFIKSMFAIHFGNYGGDVTRWIYLVFGLAGAYLFYSGNILWVESRLKKQKTPNQNIPIQRKDVRFMANLTIGSCLGCMLAIVACLFLSRWYNLFILDITSINHYLMYSYYVLFLLIVIYSFLIGAAKALPQLLLMISIFCFMIPFTTLIAIIFPQSGLFYAKDLYLIDLIILGFSILFLGFYQQAKKRLKNAPEGSIWSPIKQ